jgi:hypothetical protein
MTRFKMLGRDLESIPVQHRTWVVNDVPDYNGQFYYGHKSGIQPLENVVAYEVNDDNLVVDFNLPKPLGWHAVQRTLPESVYYSQLAIIDGYAYLFGGQASDRILIASLDRPSEWVDSGARLPTDLCKSSLAVVDGYIYLFGGNDHTGLLDKIYSAPTSDPLTWTTTGATLPSRLENSHLSISDGYIYLFGGKVPDANINVGTFSSSFSRATDVIYKAPLSNPLVWSDTGDTLPNPLFGSQLGISDGYMYLFGGLFLEDAPVDTIYKADINFPTVWTLAGTMPYPCNNGQFFTLGDKGYLISPSVSPAEEGSFSRIFRCDLSDPLTWIDTLKKLPGTITSSQVAIIYDRVFFFGGNGSSLIFASEYIPKYQFDDPAFVSYQNIAKIEVANTPTDSDLFAVLGFPYWKTDYRRIT